MTVEELKTTQNAHRVTCNAIALFNDCLFKGNQRMAIEECVGMLQALAKDIEAKLETPMSPPPPAIPSIAEMPDRRTEKRDPATL